MRKLIGLGMLCVTLFMYAASAMGGVPGGAPTEITSTGGPDTFGHVWRDNAEPGGPTFNFIDLTERGTLLGIGDDVAFGPINIGFAFPFYEAEYTSLYVNTNGLITFIQSTSTRSNYCPVPDAGVADRWIAPFWDDLIIRTEDSGGVYYQFIDEAVDKFVIQWHRFNRRTVYGDPMDMEVVLSADGLIVFQYGHINSLDRGQGQEATIGIEKDTTDGLTYLCNGAPPEYLLHSGLAIGWYRPIIDHDIAVMSIDAPAAHLVVNGGHINAVATLRNAGNFTENFDAFLEIRNSSGAEVFRDTVAMSLAADASGQASFGSWTVSAVDSFTLNVICALPTDEVPENNMGCTYIKSCGIVPLPVTQDFEGTFPPADWTVIDRGGENTWGRNTNHYRSPTHSGQVLYDWMADTDDWLVMAPIDLSLSSNVRWLYFEEQSHWADDGVRHSFYASTGEYFDPNAATMLTYHTPANHDIVGFSGDPVVLDLSAYAGNPHVWLAFRMENLEGLGTEYWWLDDINIYNIPNADVAMYSIDSPYRGVRENCDTPVKVAVNNPGLLAQTFDINVTITGAVHGPIYNETVTGVNLTPGANQIVTFSGLIEPAADNYDITATAVLAGDENPSNNVMTRAFYVSTTVEHLFDDDLCDGCLVANPFNNAMQAVRFTPLDGDFTLLGGHIYIQNYSEDENHYAEFEWVKFCPDSAGAPDLDHPFGTVPNVGTYSVPALIPVDIPDTAITNNDGDIWIVSKNWDGAVHFLCLGSDWSAPDGRSYFNNSGAPPVWDHEIDEDYMMRIDVTYAPCSGASGCEYVIGDVNNNGVFNGIDVGFGVNYFKGGALPPYSCECDGSTWFVAGDVNGNCSFNGIDITYMVRYFKGGPPPIPCPQCPPAR